jgi:hypothetical protein
MDVDVGPVCKEKWFTFKNLHCEGFLDTCPTGKMRQTQTVFQIEVPSFELDVFPKHCVATTSIPEPCWAGLGSRSGFSGPESTNHVVGIFTVTRISSRLRRKATTNSQLCFARHVARGNLTDVWTKKWTSSVMFGQVLQLRVGLIKVRP